MGNQGSSSPFPELHGHSMAAAVSHCRTVWGDTEHSGILSCHRGGTAQWPEPGSSWWPLPFHVRATQRVTTTALLSPGFINTSTSFLLSSPVLPEPVRKPSVHFPQMSLFWQRTSVPVCLCLHNTPSYPASLLRSGMSFKLIWDWIHRVYAAYWMNTKLQEVFTSGKPC